MGLVADLLFFSTPHAQDRYLNQLSLSAIPSIYASDASYLSKLSRPNEHRLLICRTNSIY